MATSKEFPPLSTEQLEIAPFGDNSCPICRLDPNDLKYLHELRFDKEWNLDKVLEYMRHYNHISPSYTKICDHFNTHTSDGARKKIAKNDKINTQLVSVIEDLPKESRIESNKKIEDAYTLLINMANDFAQKVNKVSSKINIDDVRIDDQLKKMEPLYALERFGRLLRESREQIAALSALRAPKIVVGHLLENAIDNIIHDTGFILSEICGQIQNNVVKGTPGISSDIFIKIFKDAAFSYKEKMLLLRRECIIKANSALADLEKII